VKACIRRGVKISYGAHVTSLTQAKQDGDAGLRLWDIQTADGRAMLGHRVILATGGLSFPAVGTDGSGHVLARQVRFDPSLVI
jgi:predicted flavoprotein YhiN